MIVTGLLVAFIDVPPADAAAFARWYDLDHLPEHSAKPDVVAARRYSAPRGGGAGERNTTAAIVGRVATHLTVYSFAGPLDFAGEEARGGWRALDRELARANRLWRTGRVLHASRWRLVAARAHPPVAVSAAAVPHLAHGGVLVALHRAEEPPPDLEEAHGVVGSLALSPADDAVAGLSLHLFLCERRPQDVRDALPRDTRDAVLPYDAVVPLAGD